MRGRSSAGYRVPNMLMAAVAGHVSHVADCGPTTPRMADSTLYACPHIFCASRSPRDHRDHCSRSLPDCPPLLTALAAPQLRSSARIPALTPARLPLVLAALVVSPSLSLALSCMSVSPSRGSRRLSLPLALVGSRRPSLSLSRPHASPGCPAAPRQLCCPLMRVSAGAGRSSGSGT